MAGCVQGSATESDVITLGAGTYQLLPGPSGSEDGNESEDLDTGPSSALRIVGQGQGVTIIDPLLGDRSFDVFSGSSLGLQDLTIRRGRAPAGSPGGAVRNQGTLTPGRVSFEGNQAGAGISGAAAGLSGGYGGAIWNGNAAISVLAGDSTFIANAGGDGAPGFQEGTTGYSGGNGGSGGAVYIESGTAEISGSTFSGNRAGDGGPRKPGRSTEPAGAASWPYWLRRALRSSTAPSPGTPPASGIRSTSFRTVRPPARRSCWARAAACASPGRPSPATPAAPTRRPAPPTASPTPR